MLENDVLTMLSINIFRMFFGERSVTKLKLPTKNIARTIHGNVLRTFLEQTISSWEGPLNVEYFHGVTWSG